MAGETCSAHMIVMSHPVAVNPERDLRRIAEERDWPILEFQRPVTLETGISTRVPLISGATVGAALVGAAVAILLRRRA